MKALILQNAPFEKPGYILDWLTKKKFSVHTLFLYEKNMEIPENCDTDLLIIMGGPMSIHDEKQYPWLVKGKKLIKQAIENNIPTLGICLGGQLIANIYGAAVKPARQKEIGWFPIHFIHSTKTEPLQLPDQIPSFLWHGEQFEVPPNATLFASSQGCPHQAFLMRDHVIGLQFHPEATLPLIQGMIENCLASDKTDSPFVQTAEQMLSVSQEYFQKSHHLINQLLTYLTKQNCNL